MKTVPDLMKLLALLTGWGNESCRVTFGYMRARKYNEYGETDGFTDDWGYVASTEICGTGLKVSGEGKTLEDALLNLAKDIPRTLTNMKRAYEERLKNVDDRLNKFLETP